MINVLYVDGEICVAVKPAGVESQSARRFEPDMVSEIKKYLVINKLSTPGKEPYVAVIHRLDKPVSGVMVYARTKIAAADLSAQVRDGKMKKIYQTAVCGKPTQSVDNLVDYLKQSVDGNYSQVVDKGITGAKRAELSYRLLKTEETGEGAVSLLEVELKTGRHHQIRVQLSHHGLPIWGDAKYNPALADRAASGADPTPLALCAVSLTFAHPGTGKTATFSVKPSRGIFEKFFQGE